MTKRLDKLRTPLVPERVRAIRGEAFSFIKSRFLSDGFLESLTRDELAFYIFLVLAGNRRGVSFYRYDAICVTLRLTLDDYIDARNGLVAKDLIATDGTRFQVLALPPMPPTASASTDPADIRASLLAALNSDE